MTMTDPLLNYLTQTVLRQEGEILKLKIDMKDLYARLEKEKAPKGLD